MQQDRHMYDNKLYKLVGLPEDYFLLLFPHAIKCGVPLSPSQRYHRLA